MRKLTLLMAACMLAGSAMAAQTYTYDWADGDANYLGSFGTEMIGSTALSANRPDSDGYGLVLTKNNTSQAGNAMGFLAAIWDLEAGDEVTFSVWRYDPLSGMPYFRLWAHYNNALVNAHSAMGLDMQTDDGNLMGNNNFGTQNGWEHFSHTWTIEAGNTGLVIDAVLYGELGAEIWVDDIEITVPDHANVLLPNAYYPAAGETVAIDLETWTSVKSIFR
jgi:hypothetical protein